MDSKELLRRISVEQIVDLLVNYYGIQMKGDDGLADIFATRCHHSFDEEASFKLYLYKETKSFVCYSECGSMSLFDFVMTMNDCTFAESINFLEKYFHIGINVQRGFGRPKIEAPVRPYVKKEVDFNEQLPEYDEGILNTFIPYHAIEWLYEGISDDTMNKYQIKFSIANNSIIIPHRDKDDRLVGIRERNLDKRQVEVLGRKYTPFTSFRNKITYKHSLGKNLYGIHINKEVIREYKKCIIFEAEKSVLKMDSIWGDNLSVAVGGSSVSLYQLNLLKELGVEDVYLAFDNEGVDNEKWNIKLDKICSKVTEFGFNCFIIEDREGKYLDLKDSPIDKNELVFLELYRNARKYNK